MEELISKLGHFIPWASIAGTARSFHPVLIRILWVAAGGSLGALSRYGVSLAAARWLGSRFPYGTLAVNLLGCFLIGVSFALADRTNLLSPSARLFFMTGFLGALTTFSTFALETVNAARMETVWTAVANLCLNNILGMALIVAGIGLVRIMNS